jgi:uncharacterized protein with FMN-binding domain
MSLNIPEMSRPMTSPTMSKSVFIGIAGLSLAGAAAGCAPSPQATPGTTAPTTGTSLATTQASPQGSGGGSTYKDGTYSADGTYISPNGQETVGVELSLSNDTVSAVNITVHPSNPNTRKFQGEFKDGIAGQIVGKKLDELKVSKVSGSSLTSGGFNQAVEAIKAKAR